MSRPSPIMDKREEFVRKLLANCTMKIAELYQINPGMFSCRTDNVSFIVNRMMQAGELVEHRTNSGKAIEYGLRVKTKFDVPHLGVFQDIPHEIGARL